MFNEARLAGVVAPQSATEPPPKKRVEIHVYVDRAEMKLRVEPRGLLEKEALAEVIATIGFPLRGGVRDIVLAVTAIIERHGWVPFEQWLDENKDLHRTMTKEVDAR